MRGTSLALLWGGAAVALIASGQSWWTAGASTVSGAQATSGAAPVLVLAALAGAFLSRWVRMTARRVLTVLVALLFAGGVVIALTAAAPATLPGSTLNDAAVTGTGWRPAYAIAMALAAAGSVVSLFAKPGGPRPAATPDPALDSWKALDAGEDPTVGTERGTGGEPPSERQE